MIIQVFNNSRVRNISVQVGDLAYCLPPPTPISTGASNEYHINNETPLLVGPISGVTNTNIVIDDGDIVNTPNTGDFIMFSKNKIVNNNGMKGYYAEVKLKNEATEKIELFALSSEIAESSK
tara:strand:+ start:1130 stop:1495 length:366 start_codon:yes stop_codon:yes gene_type:complete